MDTNSRYIFRVWAYSILGVGEVSAMIEVNIEGTLNHEIILSIIIIIILIIFFHLFYIDYFADSSQAHLRAMIASIIGGFIFFSMSIVFTLCVVKVCNKKKRRKIEKCKIN